MRTRISSLSPLSLSISLCSVRPTALSISRRRVTAAPVHHRPKSRPPLSPSLHLAAPLLSISLSLAADSIRENEEVFGS
ncbi:hypothetical protein P8452_23341 [Trifolium repens]|nr:hypothetical protein P8452_23341 [Trifolium repens]